MRLYVPLALGISLLASGCTGTAGQPATASSASADASCPTTTESENVAIARVWHEDAIN